MAPPDALDVATRFGIDLVAIAALAYGVYHRRHGRRDLFVIYSMFNVGLFLALVVISSGQVSAGVGFGLFAVLSIIRLRSEPFSNGELAYFFLALVLALVAGIDIGSVPLAAALSAVVVAAAAVIDHPRLLRAGSSRTLDVTLDVIPAGDALVAVLEERLGGRILAAQVHEVDFVRETARVTVRLSSDPAQPARREAELDAARL